MKFKIFGKALLMSALSAGVVLSVTSCVQSYSVGFLYVTGTVTAQSNGHGIISGYKIDHNTGKLTSIAGLPVSSGGANPVRAVLLPGSRFLYVLNRGVNKEGNGDCTTADPCVPGSSNITQFAVGGNGVLTPQETFYPQGINPLRITADGSGNYIYVLDHDAPSNASCKLALGSTATTCGDITAFQVNQTTGRLQLIVNAQVTSVNGAALPYFPVPANPIDFVLSNGNLLTISGTPATGDSAFPYSYNGGSGQLTINQNSSQPLNIFQATAIINGAAGVYVLDNEPVTIASGGNFPAGTYPSQILPFSLGSNGSLQAQTGGSVPDDATQSNPIVLMVESSGGKWVYVANRGDNTNQTDAQSGIAGYVIDPNSKQLTPMAGEPFGTGAGPQCMVEDPSNQFTYTANFNDSTVTGHSIDHNTGVLKPLSQTHNVPNSYSLQGPATWCLVDGRTS